LRAVLRVALDATPLRGPRTGIGEFCFRLLEELAPMPDLEVGAFALSRHGRGGIAGLVPGAAGGVPGTSWPGGLPGVSGPRGAPGMSGAVGAGRVRVLGMPGPGLPARVLNTSWARWAFPPAELYTGRVDVVHGTNFVVPPSRRAAMVVSVHDLTPWHYPQWCRPAARAYPRLVDRAVRRGAWVHTDSQFVADEVTGLLGVPAERVRTVHLGTSAPGPELSAPEPSGPEHEASGPTPKLLPEWVSSYVLAIGTVEPRKDLPALVAAFSRLAGTRPGLALVIAGHDGWGSEDLDQAIAASPVRDRVLRLGWVTEEARDSLVRGATVYAYPSRYEGFGLPPLQAMAAGTPVVASDAGALREVLGDAAWLVSVGDGDALADALGALLDDSAAREALSRKGLARAELFSWRACGAGLAALYRDCAAG
jgi:glycosyltransferase involved in cell wall biosynthesis